MKYTQRDFYILLNEPISWVVLSLFLVSFPHSIHLPVWLSFFVIILLCWRLYIALSHKEMPSKYYLIIISLMAFLGIYLTFNTTIGKTAGSALLILLVTIKLFESRTTRDYRLIMSLSFFIMATNFLFSQGIPTLVLMLVTVPFLLISLMRITQFPTPLNFKQDMSMALRLSFLALPLMLVLFILFPRLPGPLWQLPSDSNTAETGLSETMSPNNISQLITSHALAFRVKFETDPPPHHQLYWRAIVLWNFDGRNWTKGENKKKTIQTVEAISTPISYRITLEPHHKNWVFALDMPYSVPSEINYKHDFLLRSRNKIDSLKQYQLNAVLQYYIGQQISPAEKSAALQYPVNSNPKTIALAQQWQQELKTPERIIQKALDFFNRENFIYTLQPGKTTGQNISDDFLFNTQKGFCQHYASSFALLMRAANIPARIVLGYQGGQLNPLNQVFSIRQSDAHAWVEVWLKNKGWVRIDPTAAVAPERIENSIDAALENSNSRPFFMRLNNGILRKLNQYWDVIDNNWKQWVIGYSAKRQRDLISDFIDGTAKATDLIIYLFISLTLLMLCIAVYIIQPFRQGENDKAKVLYEKFCRKLETYGLKRKIHTGPNDFAQIAIKKFPHQQQEILYITQLYVAIQYRSKNKNILLPALEKHINKLTLK